LMKEPLGCEAFEIRNQEYEQSARTENLGGLPKIRHGIMDVLEHRPSSYRIVVALSTANLVEGRSINRKIGNGRCAGRYLDALHLPALCRHEARKVSVGATDVEKTRPRGTIADRAKIGGFGFVSLSVVDRLEVAVETRRIVLSYFLNGRPGV